MLLKIILIIFLSLHTNNQKKIIPKKLPINKNIKFNITKPSLLEKIKEDYYSDLLGTISISAIKLIDKPIYNINSNKNNIEKNITILKESNLNKENSIIFLAAHSGTGEHAYFKNLYKTKINDIIILKIKEKEYLYKINRIFEQNKNGYIQINKKYKNELVLTTCSENKNKQLIIESYLEKIKT